MATLLEFENQIYLDMFQNDGLLILAEGLGIERIFLNFIKLFCDPSHLVMILNTHDAEEQYFINKLKDSKEKDDEDLLLPVKITTETHSLNERTQAYMQGGCFFVTSRILVTDMLCERIPIDLISGILVYKAHKIVDSAQETFILRMFRQKNKKGFIKAFSDSPVYFSRSFAKVDRVMKNLFVKKLFIYPRFHVDVETELTRHKPELIEIQVGMSENSIQIQMALFEIIGVLLSEFKSCCTYIDHDYLTMEMVISKPFDAIVKSQLDPVWNQLGSKPKQLISDIKTLRLLLYYLTQYDCITFYKMLSCLKSHEKEMGRSSGWMFLDAADQLFTKARQRVYGNNLKNYSKIDINNKFLYSKENKVMATRIVEESPKLKALKQILEEIGLEKNLKNEITILITANNDRTCSQIKHFLSKNHLTMPAKASTSGSNEEKDYENYDVIDDKQTELTEDKDDEFIVKMILKPTHNNGIEYVDRPQSSRTKKLLRKVKNKPAADEITLTQLVKRNKKQTNQLEDEPKPEEMMDENDALEMLDEENEEESSMDENDRIALEIDKREFQPKKSEEEPIKENKYHNTNIFLSAYEGGTKQRMSLYKLLNDVKPKYIILYDCELSFVRQIEIFKTINYNLPLRVYFLMYSNSCEEQRYLTSIRTEKEAFELLIKEKATMIVTEEQDGKLDLSKEEQRESISVQMSNRQGGLTIEPDKPKVIVDMREFRSELPSMLHKRGFHIEPVTLEVGDYVLTPNICVERKSLNDLIESLSNGRLYNQSSAMSRAYKTPILLIEFDQKKPFLLNSNQALASNDISTNHISSKLVLLTLHFPKLRILWCSSPNETAEIFEELKSGCAQPDTELACSIKTDQVKEDSETFVKYNSVLWDILLKIPGINSKNIKDIMDKVKDLCDLCQKSEEELNQIVENSKNAKLIYEFLTKAKKELSVFEKEFDFADVEDFSEAVNANNENKKQETKSNGKSNKKQLVKIGSSSTTKKKKTK